MHNQVLYNKLK